MQFEMDISVLSIRGGNSVNTRPIGTWVAGLNSSLNVKDEKLMRDLTADTVYRVFTVIVSRKIIYFHKHIINFILGYYVYGQRDLNADTITMISKFTEQN